MAEIATAGTFAGAPFHWLPAMPPYTFLADPFGLWRDGLLHIFAERFDYRDRHGRIELLVYNSDLRLLDRRLVLHEPWHLSYPFVFEADGETWMLPEAHRSDGLILYRATDFPYGWERACRIDLDHVAIDATPLHHDGLWWLFYTVADDAQSKIGRLHVSFAENLTGPWRPHPANPVRLDPSSARPGGTPILASDRILLPVQDCTSTYGGGIRMLSIERLSPCLFSADAGDLLTPPPGLSPFDEGMHTMSAAGHVTLIDAKRTRLTLHGLAIETRREAQKIVRGRG